MRSSRAPERNAWATVRKIAGSSSIARTHMARRSIHSTSSAVTCVVPSHGVAVVCSNCALSHRRTPMWARGAVTELQRCRRPAKRCEPRVGIKIAALMLCRMDSLVRAHSVNVAGPRRVWRRKPLREIAGNQHSGGLMYIGGGVLVLILIIVVIVLLARRA